MKSIILFVLSLVAIAMSSELFSRAVEVNHFGYICAGCAMMLVALVFILATFSALFDKVVED